MAGPARSATRRSPLEPHPYVGGVSYAGVHSWAIPTTCGDLGGALELVTKLTRVEAGRIDASGGTVPANEKAFASVEPRDAIDARRLEITRATIANAMITYPALERFPEVEDAGWQAINAALRGELTPDEAVHATQAAAERARVTASALRRLTSSQAQLACALMNAKRGGAVSVPIGPQSPRL